MTRSAWLWLREPDWPGGIMTLLPDASLLTVITLRLIQRLCLLYGFEEKGSDQRIELWMRRLRRRIDFSKDLAEKQMVEKLAPRLAGRLAVRIGEESAEKWVGRMVPLAARPLAAL